MDVEGKKKHTKINRKHMAIALRFLKETNLLPLWIKYVNINISLRSRFVERHWSDTEFVDGVFGLTNFTSFITKKLAEKDKVEYSEGICIYLRFVYWLKCLGLVEQYSVDPKTLKDVEYISDKELSNNITIDLVTKKTKLLFRKRPRY